MLLLDSCPRRREAIAGGVRAWPEALDSLEDVEVLFRALSERVRVRSRPDLLLAERETLGERLSHLVSWLEEEVHLEGTVLFLYHGARDPEVLEVIRRLEAWVGFQGGPGPTKG